MPFSGILNVDKPAGMTSHDVVAWVRRLLRTRVPAVHSRLRVGHAGTLDPLATGVLLVCVGQATRLAEYLVRGVKTYRAGIRLGTTTDTADADGQVIARIPVQVTRDEVRGAMSRFLGPIEQIPPMYSALKYRGRPLYELARRGIEVERDPRRVEIHELLLEDCSLPGTEQGPQLTVRITCSSGTYVRALARDLGQALGCGAHVTALARLASGCFKLEEAVSLETLDQAAAEGRLAEVMYPPDSAVADWPPLILDEESAWRMTHGQSVASAEAVQGEWARVYSLQNEFLAIARWNRPTSSWQPHKVFVAQ